jgi:hypothetical protein
MGYPGKVVYPKGYRGFESLSLRTPTNNEQLALLFFVGADARVREGFESRTTAVMRARILGRMKT